MRRGGPRPWCLAAAGLLAAGAAGGARADGLSVTWEPRYTATHQASRDQLGNESSQDAQVLTQGLRLSLDRAIGPALGFSAGGQLEDRRTWQDQGPAAGEATTRGAYARLTLSLPDLSSGVAWDLARSAGRQVSESVSGFATWMPFELPELGLRLSRIHQYDLGRASRDQTNTGAILTARWQLGQVDARYALLWNRPSDAVSGTETSSVDQTAQVSYGDRILGDRTTVYLAARVSNQVVRTVTAGTGTVEQQRHPVAGLSLVEVFPAEPARDTLLPNPALVDGDLSAGASVDLGYGPAQSGDTAPRDLGVQLGDLLTAVNTLRVWVDRRLPAAVSAAYAWTAWQSDDNRTWLPVPITGPVVFGAFQNQFEIPIRETRARFLKVVTAPLPVGVTTEPAWAAVLVTEVQVLLVGPASALPRTQATSSAGLNASASTLLWAAANLSWDLSGSLERRLTPTGTVWSVHNGLTASQRLGRAWHVTERLERQDGDFGVGRSGQTDWSAGLLWRPLPAFSGSLVYSGQYVDAVPVLDVATGRYRVGPGNLTNSLASLARADLYEGVSVQANASGALERRPDGTAAWSGAVNGSTSVTPHPAATLGAGWQSARTTVVAPGGAATTTTTTARLDGSLTLRPTSLVSLSGTVSRILAGATPTTTGTAQVNYSPLRGDLQLSLAYSRTFDTTAGSTTEVLAPSLRWNVRPGVQLTGSWTRLEATSLVGRTATRALGLLLSVTL